MGNESQRELSLRMMKMICFGVKWEKCAWTWTKMICSSLSKLSFSLCYLHFPPSMTLPGCLNSISLRKLSFRSLPSIFSLLFQFETVKRELFVKFNEIQLLRQQSFFDWGYEFPRAVLCSCIGDFQILLQKITHIHSRQKLNISWTETFPSWYSFFSLLFFVMWTFIASRSMSISTERLILDICHGFSGSWRVFFCELRSLLIFLDEFIIDQFQRCTMMINIRW